MPGAYKVILLQLGVTAVLTLAFSIWQIEEGRAALMGGLAVGLPNAFYAWITTKRQSAEGVLVNGVVKFLMGLALIAFALKAFQPPPLGFFSALVGVVLAHAVGGAMFDMSVRGTTNKEAATKGGS